MTSLSGDVETAVNKTRRENCGPSRPHASNEVGGMVSLVHRFRLEIEV